MCNYTYFIIDSLLLEIFFCLLTLFRKNIYCKSAFVIFQGRIINNFQIFFARSKTNSFERHDRHILLEMSNNFTHSVPSRTAADQSSSGSQRACPARAAIFKMPAQTRTAEYIGLRGPSRGTPLYQTACYSFFHECSSRRVV